VAPGIGDQMLEQQGGDAPVVHVVSYRQRDLRLRRSGGPVLARRR
jgi:hypothetical protein